MKEVTILSGKGGTGKTSITAASAPIFAVLTPYTLIYVTSLKSTPSTAKVADYVNGSARFRQSPLSEVPITTGTYLIHDSVHWSMRKWDLVKKTPENWYRKCAKKQRNWLLKEMPGT